MDVVFYIAETITAENEPASLVFAGLKNERVKETNPRKGTETERWITVRIISLVKETNPRKGTETKKPLGAFLFYSVLWGFHPHTFKLCHIKRDMPPKPLEPDKYPHVLRLFYTEKRYRVEICQNLKPKIKSTSEPHPLRSAFLCMDFWCLR